VKRDDFDHAAREYVKTHWGLRGPVECRRLRVPNPFAETPVEMGALVAVVYRTRKGVDRELVDYEHEFERPLPRLCFTSAGLIIAGGGYRVDTRGIVG
jgi:hypothetical protein